MLLAVHLSHQLEEGCAPITSAPATTQKILLPLSYNKKNNDNDNNIHNNNRITIILIVIQLTFQFNRLKEGKTI